MYTAGAAPVSFAPTATQFLESWDPVSSDEIEREGIVKEFCGVLTPFIALFCFSFNTSLSSGFSQRNIKALSFSHC